MVGKSIYKTSSTVCGSGSCAEKTKETFTQGSNTTTNVFAPPVSSQTKSTGKCPVKNYFKEDVNGATEREFFMRGVT